MKYSYLLLLFVLLVSCKSPSELLIQGKFDHAFSKALSEIKRGKNVEENTKVLQTASKLRVGQALQYSSIMTKTDKVSNWVKTQKKVYVLLRDLGKANKILNGVIDNSYDILCNEKKEIDYQIVDHYYGEGHGHLDRFYNEGNKVDARHAYKSFKNCEKYEGQNFFPQLYEDMEDARQNGIVYYVSDYGRIGSSLFLKPLPRNADFKPDCDINIYHGFVSFNSSESSSEDIQTKEIETGTEAVTDTSGRTTYTPIHETVTATITTTTITITAEVTTELRSHNVTGQCSIGSSHFTTQVSDTYEEISVSGDTRALKHHVSEESGEPLFFKSGLEDELMDRADAKIRL